MTDPGDVERARATFARLAGMTDPGDPGAGAGGARQAPRMAEQGCPFCKAIAGEPSGQIVDEDERTVAFMHPEPATLGHALVVPRRHARDLLEIAEEDLAATVAAAQRLSAKVIAQLGADGVNVINGCGRSAWQTVAHFHIHVIPRYEGEPLRLVWRSAAGGEDEIAAAATQLRG